MESENKLKDLIKSHFEKGEIVIATIEGLQSAKLEKFVSQPAEGILYDLNRDELTALTMAEKDDPRWINDFATAKVIRELKRQLEEKQKS